jgi:hypothetical protein
MPAERITPGESDSLAHARDVAGESARTIIAVAIRLPLEAWLALACFVVVLWAVGWV